MAARNKVMTVEPETSPLLAEMAAEPVVEHIRYSPPEEQGLATQHDRPLTVEDLMARAIEKGDTETMASLYAMRREMQEEAARRAFNEAMNTTQSQMRQVSADAANPQTHSRYATYSALDKALRPIYTRNGFSVSFNTGAPPDPDTILVLAEVSHEGGHSKGYQVPAAIDTKGPQGKDVMTRGHAFGSAFSYGKRYLSIMIWNVAIGDDDDDGNGGTEFIALSPGQLLDLKAKIEETGANLEKFLGYFEIESLEVLPATRFSEAIRTLIEIERRRKTK